VNGHLRDRKQGMPSLAVKRLEEQIQTDPNLRKRLPEISARLAPGENATISKTQSLTPPLAFVVWALPNFTFTVPMLIAFQCFTLSPLVFFPASSEVFT